ncbi:hypothetical protein ACFQ49_07585 [Kroppenstedtia eburnea]|uniref:hypothetical protein n=1 Tax=Kroppenstedtia eburnea TaxID=714067 RepID=UPI0036340E7E
MKRDKWGIISPLRHHLTGELDSKGEYDPVKSGEIKREGGGESMFLHGIPFVHLVSQYPELSPGGRKRRKSPAQKTDARRLVRHLGYEPVHLLRSSREYPLTRCIEECLGYGDTILAFPGIPYPRVQLSRREWGVRRLNIFDVAWILTTRENAREWFHHRLPGIPVLYWRPDVPKALDRRRARRGDALDEQPERKAFANQQGKGNV